MVLVGERGQAKRGDLQMGRQRPFFFSFGNVSAVIFVFIFF